MQKVRVRFQKTGRARYCSHLDLTRLFSRALARSGLPVHFTEGFHTHAYLVFGPPLSLGYEGLQEVLDFSLDEDLDAKQVYDRLCGQLPEGIRLVRVEEQLMKLSAMAWADYDCELTIADAANWVCPLRELFSSDHLTVIKKSKRGEKQTDLVPMIQSVSVELAAEQVIRINCRLLCGPGETLNPEYLLKAARDRLPGFEPEFAQWRRHSFFCADGVEFR